MKRLCMQKLHAWNEKKGRKPLILSGVRQTGKTYLIERFGEEAFGQTHTINFEEMVGARSVFEGDLNPRHIINQLQFLLETEIDKSRDLVFFDEIQACPNALTSLKYFCEQMPELAVCSAGSLLGLHLAEGSYPVGKVDMLELHPMTFSEFLLGIGDAQAYEFFNAIDATTIMSDAAHARFWELLKMYFVTGGLPEAVKVFAEQKENLYVALHAVRDKQKALITAYYADIAKHAGKVNAMHIDRTWRAVPAQLSKAQDQSTSRFKFKDILPQVSRYAQLIDVIDWLENANLVIRVPIVGTSAQPLQAYTKENMFKLFLFDVGLLGAMTDLDPKPLMSYDYGTYKGYFAENYVLQQLSANLGSTLYNWCENRHEIEFLLQHQGEIIPIEVKSGKVTKAQSLKKYGEKYQPKTSIIFSANNLTRQNDGVLRLPLYLAERVVDFLQ